MPNNNPRNKPILKTMLFKSYSKICSTVPVREINTLIFTLIFNFDFTTLTRNEEKVLRLRTY
jgi:hypothetical protein